MGRKRTLSTGFRFGQNRNLSATLKNFLILLLRAIAKPPLTLLLVRANNLRHSRKTTALIVLEPASPVNWVHFREHRFRRVIFLEQGSLPVSVKAQLHDFLQKMHGFRYVTSIDAPPILLRRIIFFPSASRCYMLRFPRQTNRDEKKSCFCEV